MSDTTPSNNRDCSSDYHKQHLCYLMYMGTHLEDKAAYNELLKDPQYRCQRCARSTHSTSNLCVPEKIIPDHS